MKIAVNTRFLIKDKIEGIGRFTYETLKEMVMEHPEHEFVFFFDREFGEEFLFAKNVTGLRLTPPARHPFLFIWYFEWSIFRALKKVKADIFLSCDGFLSLRSKVPQIAIIHDLAFEHYPEDVSYLVRYYYKFFFPRFARKAAHICTVSEFSKRDIIEKYHIEQGKISVVYNGASPLFKPLAEEIKEKVRSNYTSGYNYFVYVGAIQPRKNIGRLLLAFDKFKKEDINKFKLLIVGRKAWKTKGIEETYNKIEFREHVLFTGRIPDEELALVLASAKALTYIPYLEGFGIPILEAMQCGTPVITSNVTAMPEVAGNAGLLVNPFQVDEICAAMKRISEDSLLQTELSEKAMARAGQFSWKNTAALVWESVRTVSGQFVFNK